MSEFIARAEGNTSKRDQFPTTEDWIALQGGRPRVFRQPQRPNAAWRVVHVYEEHGEPRARFQSGLIVATLADRTSKIGLFGVPERVIPAEDDEPELVVPAHNVAIPTFMVRSLHGEVCERRSGRARNNDVDRVTNQTSYEQLLQRYRSDGMQEVRFSITADDQFQMRPLPSIPASRPLA